MLNEKLCPACNGNDKDAPCAYPSEGKNGCLRDARIERMKMEQQYKDIGEHGAFCGCYFCNPIVYGITQNRHPKTRKSDTQTILLNHE